MVVAAADTFRAAAIDQLAVWCERAGVEMVKQSEGSDPAAVVFDAIAVARKRAADVLIIDTAGRLQNKKNLMNELAKIDRVIVLFKFLKNEFFKMMHPNNITAVTINGKGMKLGLVQKTLAFLCLYVIVIFVSGMVLVMLGVSLRESFFYTLSAISNAGIGTDTVGLGQGFSALPDTAKWVLSLVMLTGRLELYTVLLIFTPYFWTK